MSTKPLVVAVDGIIGAGKTTCIETLRTGLIAKGWKVVVVKEPVDEWQKSGILERFYKDPKRWGYHFQTKAFHDRVMENKKMFQEYGKTADVFILERSPFTDTLFMELLHEEGSVDDLEMQHYKQWWNLWHSVMPYLPDLFIYLKPDVDVCMKRLRMRNREGEEGVSLDYQRRLQEKHDKYFKEDSIKINDTISIPCIKIQTNDNFKDDEEIKKRLVSQFEDILMTLPSVSIANESEPAMTQKLSFNKLKLLVETQDVAASMLVRLFHNLVHALPQAIDWSVVEHRCSYKISFKLEPQGFPFYIQVVDEGKPRFFVYRAYYDTVEEAVEAIMAVIHQI